MKFSLFETKIWKIFLIFFMIEIFVKLNAKCTCS